MTSSVERQEATARAVSFTDHSFVVDLTDGRALSVPLAWFPRLLRASADERGNWELMCGGEGIHWPDVDEDISVEGLLRGIPSAEARGHATAR